MVPLPAPEVPVEDDTGAEAVLEEDTGPAGSEGSTGGRAGDEDCVGGTDAALSLATGAEPDGNGSTAECPVGLLVGCEAFLHPPVG